MKSSALRWENSASKWITTSSSTAIPSITSRFTSKLLISFGALSGCSTSSGCGSKVSTVSAPSITARWPRWTPSKVPIATSRARGVASSSRVTLIDISPTFSPKRVADRRDQLGDRGDRQLAARLLDPERADRDPAQARAVGVVERLDQGPHVGAGTAFDLVVGALAVAVRFLAGSEQFGPVHLDVADRRGDGLAAVGLLVEPLAADADRRGHRHLLAHGPGRQLQRVGDRPGLCQLAVRVAGARGPAQPRGRQVGLRQADEEALQARRRAGQDQQEAGGEWVERARVASFDAALAAHLGDHVV